MKRIDPHPQQALLWLLGVLVLTAGIVGLWARFVDLGHWPLGVDEFYLSRSVDNILATGLPKFFCGGYYTRSALVQYLIAGLRSLGESPEFAGRLVPAVASIIALPGAYLLARRIGNTRIALLTVIVLLLSTWEVEMARFERMYAPFQAVFVWYAVFFLSYVLDGKRKALIGMVIASLAGVLVWEGGVFLGLLNLLPPFFRRPCGRLTRRDLIYLTAMAALLAVLYACTRDLRGFVTAPDDNGADAVAEHGRFWLWGSGGVSPVWALLCAVPLLPAIASARWIWSLKTRWLAAATILSALISALVHQFLLCSGILIIAVLLGILDRRTLLASRSRYFWIALFSALGIWLAYGVIVGQWQITSPPFAQVPNRVLAILEHTVGFPDLLNHVVRPWARTVPIMSLVLSAGVGLLLLVELSSEKPAPDAQRVALCIAVVLLLALGIADTERYETRYSFFLFPLAWILTLRLIDLAFGQFLPHRRWAPAASAVCAFTVFMLCEDFQPGHLAGMDTDRVNFRLGMSDTRRDHYYPRGDISGAARWLDTHASPTDIIATGVPNLDQYFTRSDYFYLNAGEARYEAYACPGGTQERWTHKPLLYSARALTPLVETGRPLLLVLYPGESHPLLAAARSNGWRVRLAWQSIERGILILEIKH